MELAHREVLALGAKPLDVDDRQGERGFRVFADPAGHPLSIQPATTFCSYRVGR